MRGHLRKRSKSSWAVVVDIGHDPSTGKRRQKWITVKGTKRDAERRLAEIVRDLDAGTYVEPSRLTLTTYLDQWMRDYVATSVRPRTAQGYGSIVRRLQRDLGGVMLANLKPLHVQRYYAELLDEGLSAQTVLHHHRLLSQALKQAVKWDMLPRNIMERVTPPPRRKPEFRSLDASEARRLLRAAEGADYHLPIHLAVYTGLRRSEILGLRWSDVALSAQTLTVTRTMVPVQGDPMHINEPKSPGSRRTVSYSTATDALLRQQREQRQAQMEALGLELTPHTQVCVRSNGAMMAPDGLSHAYGKIAAGCGIRDVRFHDLRHTHASLLLTAGVPVHVVQGRLGHESIQTTVDTYGHVLPSSDSEASVILERSLDAVQ